MSPFVALFDAITGYDERNVFVNRLNKRFPFPNFASVQVGMRKFCRGQRVPCRATHLTKTRADVLTLDDRSIRTLSSVNAYFGNHK